MTSDEWYTPRSAVVPIIEYLKPNSRVLCPFDTENSNFVKALTERGFQVTHSHISEGVDFFSLPKPDVDYVISNPPFSKFDRILTKLYEWGIPFAMVWTSNRIFDSRERIACAVGGGGNLIPLPPGVIPNGRKENIPHAELSELLLVPRDPAEADPICRNRTGTMRRTDINL